MPKKSSLPLDEPAAIVVSVKMTKRQRKNLRLFCALTDRTQVEVVSRAIDEYINTHLDKAMQDYKK